MLCINSTKSHSLFTKTKAIKLILIPILSYSCTHHHGYSQTSCSGTGSSGTYTPPGAWPQSQRLWARRAGHHRRTRRREGRWTTYTGERERERERGQVHTGYYTWAETERWTTLLVFHSVLMMTPVTVNGDTVKITYNLVYHVFNWSYTWGREGY